MFAFILKLKLLYKVINFDSNNNLCISYGGSSIKMTPQGDIEIKAKRNLINNYELLFQDCDKDFINDINEAVQKGNLEQVLSNKIDSQILEEAKCQI